MTNQSDFQESERLQIVRQEAIAIVFADFVEELKLIDVVDLVAFIKLDMHANLAELIQSSSELYFKEGVLRYSMAASAALEWDSTPIVAIDLEFFNKGVWLYLSVVLGFPDNAVNVSYLEIPEAKGDREKETDLLLAALQDARLLPLRDQA